jgi:predicted phosphodiesterase
VLVALSKDLQEGPPPAKKEVLGKIATLLDRNGIDVDEVGRITRVSLYQSLTKNDEGEAEIHDLVGVQLSPSWEDGPQWDPVSQAAPVKCSVKPVKGLQKPEGWRTAVIVPDAQIGYYRDVDGGLVPTHDEDAISLCLSAIRDLNPEVVVCVGDMLDAPEFGKYRLSPAFALTTQASIDRATTFAAELRACAPDAEIIWIAGNHEERITNAALDNLKAAFGLKRGNDRQGLPVLSVPFLCRFDDADISYLAGYPASSYWINQRIKVIHGNKVRSNGSTAHAYFNGDSKSSVLYGHIHRREWAEKTRQDWDGAKTILAASPGTLARTDGAVPSTRGGLDLDGRPLTVVEDWQQGYGVVTFQPGDGNFFYEQVAIHDGQAWFRGKLYTCD